MANAPLPIEAPAIQTRSGEQVRLMVENYSGRVVVNIRKWYKDADGVLRPTRSGVSLSVRHLPSLARGAATALAAAEAAGLLDPADSAVPIDPASAISFAVDRIDDHFIRKDFLVLWRQGRWDELRANWPEAFKA